MLRRSSIKHGLQERERDSCKIIRRSRYVLNKNCNILIYRPNTTQVNDIVYALNEKIDYD